MTTYLQFPTALLWTALLLSGGASARAAINLTADPGAPGFPDIHVVDARAFGDIAHGFSGTRMLRQTFNNPVTLDIGEIVLSLSLNGTDGAANDGAGEGGLVINLYEVSDVNGADWTAAGPGISPIQTWTIPQTTSIPATDGRLSISFTGGDVFTLPARDAGTEGYGLEIASVDGVTSMGAWHVTPNDEIDRYAAGVFYREDGTISRVFRDAGLSIFAVGATPPAPGDVTGDGMALLDDFDVISQNLRTVVGGRTLGDLTGDGNVNFLDFREWKANFVPPSSAGVVPEPASALLLGASSLALLLGSRRRRTTCGAVAILGASRLKLARVFVLFAALLAWTDGISTARAAIVLNGDDPPWPEAADNNGDGIDDLGVMTVDAELNTPNQRNVAATRMLRQAFQIDSNVWPNGFNVGGIVLNVDFGGADGGLNIRFWNVADTNAPTWDPVGNPIKHLVIPVGDDVPATGPANRLQIDLSGFDLFSLDASAGTAGYAIELFNGDGTTNMGGWRHSNSGTEVYLEGDYYDENGNQPGGGVRDMGLALITTTEVPPLPGDTEPDGDVDLDDLAVIRANFFMENAAPTDGDFSGDSVVSFEDLQIWKDNRTASTSTATNVPEPGGIALAMLGGSLGLLTRRTRLSWRREATGST